ncbi:hypothetical protein LIER_10880 [Lithospermum erythrorhizon]|uniref:Transposase MuDR plant domain-containing protein n=1 Tax=Lithospermum erythrorhizon TaxID=34254 RepID=A0AAV3PMH1_LITER
MGMTGICFLYYKKPSLSFDNRLVHLQMQAHVDDMVKWVRGVREIGMYVTHPSRMIAKNMILLEMYNSLRSMWPKATLKEIDDEKARLLGFEEECEQKGEVQEGEVANEGNDEEDVVGGDEFMETNNVVCDDFDTDVFIREDYFDEEYEPLQDSEDVEENERENENLACFLNEEEAEDEMGPVLPDIGSLPEVEFETSEHLVELSGKEDDEEVVCSSSRRKKAITSILYNRKIHLANPIILPNMVFCNAADFRELIRHYAMKTKKPLKFVKNDKWRVCVRCQAEGCGFTVFCSRLGKLNDLSIKSMVEEHTCGSSTKIDMVKVNDLSIRML